MLNKVSFESDEHGKRAILAGPWSVATHDKILSEQPQEIVLNTSLGWAGEHIEFIVDFHWLKSLVIIDFGIKDVSPIHKLTNLQNLELITYCKTIVDFSAFQLLTKCAFEWRAKSGSLFECTTLKELFINNYKGKDSHPLASLSKLETLSILNSPMDEIDHLSMLQNLKSLRLANLSKIRTLKGLTTLHELRYLNIDNCKQIDRLDEIAGLEKLEFLNIANIGDIETLSPLKNLKNLRKLCFPGSTNVKDGDLDMIFQNQGLDLVAFQNRRHYSRRREAFELRPKI